MAQGRILKDLTGINSGQVKPSEDLLLLYSISGNTSNKIVINDFVDSIPVVQNDTFYQYTSDTKNILDEKIDINFFSNYTGNTITQGTGNYSTVRNGANNSAIGNCSTIIGGVNNYTDKTNSVILGSNLTATTTNTTFVESLNVKEFIYDNTGSAGLTGQFLTATADGFAWCNTGGNGNIIGLGGGPGLLGPQGSSFIGGGDNNTITQDNYNVIGGGQTNTLKGGFSSISSGQQNLVSEEGRYSSINGGCNNTLSGYYSVIGGGINNNVNGKGGEGFQVIGGGCNNSLGANRGSFIGGGCQNTVSGNLSLIVGGENNLIGENINDSNNSVCSIIGGGERNTITNGNYSGIFAGSNNCVTGNYSLVNGGFYNTAINNGSTVIGGSFNLASGSYSVVGGCSNTASGTYSVVLGNNNISTGTQSYILGTNNNDSGFSNVVMLGYVGDATRDNTVFINNTNIRGYLYDSNNTSGTGNQILSVDRNSGYLSWVNIDTPLAATSTLLNTKLSVSGGTIYGNLVVNGNLQFTGTATTVNRASLLISNPIIVLASGTTTPTKDAGFLIDRGVTGDTVFIWSETDKEFRIGYTNSIYTASTINITSYSNLRLNQLAANYISDINGSTGRTNYILGSTSNGIVWIPNTGNTNNALDRKSVV